MDAIISSEDKDMATHLRERWRFDQDNEPTVGPSDQDYQALLTDWTVVWDSQGSYRIFYLFVRVSTNVKQHHTRLADLEGTLPAHG